MLKKLTAAGVVAAAATGVVLLAGPASAETATDGTGGILSGNQVIVPITVPANVCGNAVSVIGLAGAGCKGGAAAGVVRRYPYYSYHPSYPYSPTYPYLRRHCAHRHTWSS